jgi:hypothetical protein
MTSSYEERTAYIQEARVAVRMDRDREVEAKLEKMQGSFGQYAARLQKSSGHR